MPLAVFDVDGTLTSAHVWKGLMAAVRRHRYKTHTHRLYLLTHYPLYAARKLHLLSEMTFRRRWAADLGWYLRGMSRSQVHALGDWIATEYLKHSWREAVVARLRDHLARGHTVILLSAAPQPLIRRIARHLGTPHGVGTRFALERDRYNGQALPPLCLGEGKYRQLEAYLREQGLSSRLEDGWAYADSSTDLPILERAAHPVAVHPDERLLAAARRGGWEIIA